MASTHLDRSAAIIALINPTETPAGAVDVDFDLALALGVNVPGGSGVNPVPPFAGYADFSAAIKVAVRQSSVALLAAMAPSPWVDMTPLTGAWVNEGGAFQTPQYRKEYPDAVRLRGTVQSGAGTIFTLPVGFRPPADVRFACANGTPTDPAFITVTSAGVVSLVSGNNTQVSLDNIVFGATV